MEESNIIIGERYDFCQQGWPKRPDRLKPDRLKPVLTG